MGGEPLPGLVDLKAHHIAVKNGGGEDGGGGKFAGELPAHLFRASPLVFFRIG